MIILNIPEVLSGVQCTHFQKQYPASLGFFKVSHWAMPHLGQCHNVRGIACGIVYVMPYKMCGIGRGIAHSVAVVEALA